MLIAGSVLQMAASASTQVISQQTSTKTPQRLVFLDVVRGITIAFMILVNNHGNEKATYWPLEHAEWNGWTPTDLVFPIFLFLVGITTVFSTASRIARGESKSSLFWHALRRAAILFALGVLIHGFPSYPLATLRDLRCAAENRHLLLRLYCHLSMGPACRNVGRRRSGMPVGILDPHALGSYPWLWSAGA